MTIGKRIKNRRKELGMNAEALAERIGVSPSTIYRYESGDIENMGIEKLAPVARALNVTEAFLMGWPEDEDGIINVGSPFDADDVCLILQDVIARLHENDKSLNFKGHKLDDATRQILIQQIDNAISICNINIFAK